MAVPAAALPRRLRRDPRPAILLAGDPALAWVVRHDLDGEAGDPRYLWGLEQPTRILRGQRGDGSWPYPSAGRIRSQENYDLLQTFKRMLELVARYRLDNRHPAIAAGAEFMLAHQRPEGDIRGIYGPQFSPNYSAAMLAVLVDARMGGDPRVRRGLDWLLSTRQRDGGWVVPLRTLPGPAATAYTRGLAIPDPVPPDRARASSHMVTGIVVRALAAHSSYRHRPETVAATELLLSRFGRPDQYPDRRSAGFWYKLQFPFRWTDALSTLDVAGLVGLPAGPGPATTALAWLVEAQRPDGLWRSAYRSGQDPLADEWVTFAAARALARFGVGPDDPDQRPITGVTALPAPRRPPGRR